MSQQNNKPIKNFRAGTIQASVWRTEIQRDSQRFVRYSVRVQRQYRKDDGNYENTDYFFPEDLPKLALVANEAFKFISLKESTETEESTPV